MPHRIAARRARGTRWNESTRRPSLNSRCELAARSAKARRESCGPRIAAPRLLDVDLERELGAFRSGTCPRCRRENENCPSIRCLPADSGVKPTVSTARWRLRASLPPSRTGAAYLTPCVCFGLELVGVLVVDVERALGDQHDLGLARLSGLVVGLRLQARGRSQASLKRLLRRHGRFGRLDCRLPAAPRPVPGGWLHARLGGSGRTPCCSRQRQGAERRTEPAPLRSSSFRVAHELHQRQLGAGSLCHQATSTTTMPSTSAAAPTAAAMIQPRPLLGTSIGSHPRDPVDVAPGARSRGLVRGPALQTAARRRLWMAGWGAA